MDMNTIKLKSLDEIQDFLQGIMKKQDDIVDKFHTQIRDSRDVFARLNAIKAAPQASVAQVGYMYARDMYQKISTKDSKATPASILNYCLQECHPRPGNPSTSIMANVEADAVLAFYVSVAKFITGNGEFF